MRGWTRLAASASASAALVLLGVAGCVGDETESGPTGPNGYTLAGTLEDVDVQVWYDHADDAELTDIVLMHGTDIVGLCLGDAGTRCVEGDKLVQAYVIYIAPADAVRADLVWAGETLEMTPMNDGIEDGLEHVFVAAPPALDPGVAASPQVTAFDDADQPL